MSDIVYDARIWLEGRPRRTRTHWDDCHLSSGHTECLVRKLLDEIERLRFTDAEREAIEQAVQILRDHDAGDSVMYDTLRGLLERHRAIGSV